MARILLAIDGSESAATAVRRAVGLLGPGHEFVALSVVRPSLIATSSAPIPSGMPGSLEVVEDPEPDPDTVLAASRRVEVEARDDIDSATHHLGVVVHPRVEMGDPAETILRVARDERVEVVVLGSHGSGRARQLLLGSVSQQVIKNSTALVLVLGAQTLPPTAE